ncbi:tear acid lipase-like protein isoform X2 [Aethina tumida]|nr:tear acid lipase-like protein isoform X2 [Aethina tumida]
MFRILRENPKGIVVLQHPISSDGSIWMDQGNASTAITFWEQGYEVWIPNHRGTWYSEGHVNLTINDYNYWNWTFHEIGIYDYAAFFEKISEVTNSNDLIFVGHSMAGSSSLAYASLYPEHAQKYLKILILMGPVSYMKYVRSPLKEFSPAVDMLRAFTKRLGIGGICTKDSTCIKLITWASNLPIKDLVVAIIMVFTGWTPGEFDPPLYYYMTTGLKGTGLGVYYHYAQIVNAGGKYQMWDYGEQGNLIAYNSTTPPEYPVENINVPVYLVTSSSDSCGTVGDSQILYSKLPKTTRTYGKFETTGLNHIDVHWGKDRNKVYDRIFNLINKIL